MELPSSSLRDSPMQAAAVPHQPNTTSRLLPVQHSCTSEGSLLRKASIATLAGATTLGVNTAAPMATTITSSVVGTIVPPLQEDSLALSSILSGEPSPPSEWSNKTQKYAPPLSSSADPSCRRFSVDSGPQEDGAFPLAYKRARSVVTTHSPTSGLITSQPTDCGSPYIPSHASSTTPPEYLTSSSPLRGMSRHAEVFVSLEDAFFAAVEPEATQPRTAAALCTLQRFTGTNGQCSPQAMPPPTSIVVPAVATPVVIKDQTSCNNASVCLRDSVQHLTERGDPSAHHPHLSPLSSSSSASRILGLDNNDDGASDDDRLGTPTPRRFVQRLLFAEPSPVAHTTGTPPFRTADVAALNNFDLEYSLFQPAAHSPRRFSSRANTSLLSLSQTDLMTGVFAETDTQYQLNWQQQQPQLLSLYTPTNTISTPPRTAVADHSSLGTVLHPQLRKAKVAIDEAQTAAATESRNGTTPFRSFVGCTSASTKGPTAEMETQVFPRTPLIATPVQLSAPRTSLCAETWTAHAVKAPRQGLSDSEGIPWCGPNYPGRCTALSPQKVDTAVDKALQPLYSNSGSVTDHPCHDLYSSSHTPRDQPAVSHASCSPSESSSFARSYAALFSSGRSIPLSERDEATTMLSMSAVPPDELDYCSTPTSPHTPLANHTPGPVGVHDSIMAQRSSGHSYSRYCSQLLSRSITPQKSARRTFSRQTTPSQSFRSKVQSHSFESQQQHSYMIQHASDVIKGDRQLGTYQFLINGEPPSVTERDYLAPSRNPFSLYRTLDLYVTNPSLLTSSAAPDSGAADFLSENDLSESQAMFAAALERTVVRPDAAVVLYGQLVPSPSTPPGVSHRALAEKFAAYRPLAALLPQDLNMEHCLSPTSPSLCARVHGSNNGRTRSAPLEQSTPTTPAAAQGLAVESPTRVAGIHPQLNAALISSLLPTETHVGAPGSLQLSAMKPLTAQSPCCHWTQPKTLSVITSTEASCCIPPCGPPVTDALSDSSDELHDAPAITSSRRQPQRGECGMRDNDSPLPQCPTQSPNTMALCVEFSTLCASQQLHFEDNGGDKNTARSGCDEAHAPFSHQSVAQAGSLKLVHTRSPLDVAAEGSDGAGSSHGSPNYLCNTVSNLSFTWSGQQSPLKMTAALRPPSAPPASPTRVGGAALVTHGSVERGPALLLPSLNFTRLANHTRRPQFLTPTLQQRPSPGRGAAGMCISTESSWIHGAQTPVVASTSLGAPSSDHADISTAAQIGCHLMESFSDPFERIDTSEEELPGDRFQAHHVFQFLHSITPTCEGGDIRPGRRERDCRAIPLCVEMNGVTWLAVHRLDGLPYAVKEVPAAAFNLAELQCLTLSMTPPSGRSSTSSAAGRERLPDQHTAALTADDRLEAEDCIARYYSVSTPPQSSINPEVRLLQLEYFPRGSLSELARHFRGEHGAVSSHALSPLVADGEALSSRFWLAAVTQGLRGLRVLHHAGLIHGSPLPLSLFLCGSAPSSLRFKWSCFGSARADADIYPTESLPAWVSEAVARLCQMAAADGTTVSPDAIEVAVFSLGILEVLVDYVARQLVDVLPPRDSQSLRELEWIEAVVTHQKLELYAREEESGEDTFALVRLMRFLWDVSNTCSTANQALAQLSARVNPAARVVEQVYECELARLTRQLEKRRHHLHRRQQQEQLQSLHSASMESSSLTDATLLRSPEVKMAVTGTSSRRRIGFSDLSSPPLHLAPDPALRPVSASSFGVAAPSLKSRSATPKIFCSPRLPPHHTLLKHPFTVSSKLFLPSSTTAVPATAAVSFPLESLRVERTVSELSGWGCTSSTVGHRRRCEIHPVILKAANHMLENSVNGSGDGTRDPMTELLRPAVESMCQRGWTTLYAGVPLSVAGGIDADASAGAREATESLMKSLRPLTSFE
ncbi:hypothetical protein MNV84_06189 [Leishmania braziliensis]|nr:hypothetical protein MNV84_06189 [Leishmania braziliensis]